MLSSAMPDWVTTALGWVGLRWPQGDPDALTASADAWFELGSTLTAQEKAAVTAAGAVWAPPNYGPIADTFQTWWHAPGGPSANLRAAADAADKTGTALRGLATQITILRATFVAELGFMLMTLGSVGLLVVVGTGGAGSLAVGAGGQFLIRMVRRALLRQVQVAVAAIAATLVTALLRKAAEELVPAATLPGTVQVTEREPTPGKGDGRPLPVVLPWTSTGQPRCQARPDSFLPISTPPVLIGNPDPRTVGGRVIMIKQEIQDTARVVTIHGVLGPALDESQRLQTPQYELQAVRQSLFLPPDSYDACHAYGPRFGTEVAAGMALCPTAVNQNGGAMYDLESRVQRLYNTLPPGSWAEMSLQSSTFRTADYPDAQTAAWLPSPADAPSGAALMKDVNYTLTVCRPGQVLDQYAFGIRMDTPTIRNGTWFVPNNAIVYGRVPP